MRTKLSFWIGLTGALAAVSCVETPIASAGVLDTQSNPVALNFADTPLWTNPAKWDGFPKYPADPAGDGSPADGYDWFYTQVLHNDDWFFIRYHNSHPFAGDRQLMYFDSDSDRTTGLPGFTGTLAVGAEFYLSGAGLNRSDGSFIDFMGWNNVQDANGEWDVVISIDRATFMPGVTSFNFVNQNHDQSGDDWYPDAGNNFPGDFFRYEAPPVPAPIVTAFGREWTVFEPAHRDNAALVADVTGAPDSLTMTGVFGYDTNAITPLTVEVGTKVSYDFAITNEQRDPIGDGPSNWIGDALGVFSTSPDNPSNAFLATTRLGPVFDFGVNARQEIHFTDINTGIESSVSLAGHDLAQGVHIEWSFNAPDAVEISVFSLDGSTLLGSFVDDLSHLTLGLDDIQGFRFNVWDSEQTLTITNFTVSAGLPGDYNRNGTVDAADYVWWRENDANNPDGYITWRANFGRTTADGAGQTASSASVPEPSTLALCGSLFALAVAGRARTRLRD